MRDLFGKIALFSLQKDRRDMYCTSNERYECSLSTDVFDFDKSEEVKNCVQKCIFFVFYF